MNNSQPDKKALKVYFFGDSICFGQLVSPHKTWINLISVDLEKIGIDTNYDIIINNPSINGCTTRQALERMPYDIQSHCPEILLVQFGMNDCNYWESDHGNPRVSPDAFAANMKEIITRAKTFGAQEIIVNTNHISGRTGPAMPYTQIAYQDSNAKYNELIRSVLQKDDPCVSLVDIENIMLHAIDGDISKAARFLLPDMIHLNEAGHKFYYQQVLPVLKQAVLKCIERKNSE